MKIGIGSDHAGFLNKKKLIAHLRAKGHEVIDYGTESEESTDYPDYALLIGKAVSRGEVEKGVLACGTGVGMSIAANKVRGVRAAAVQCVEAARLSRQHNDANIICVGSRVNTYDEIEKMIDTWLDTEFEGGERHVRRIEKIAELDKERC